MGELFSLKGKINNEFLTNKPVNLDNVSKISKFSLTFSYPHLSFSSLTSIKSRPHY